MVGRSKHLSTPDDKAAADRKHLTCLAILGYTSEPAISTGSGICQMPSNLLHTNRPMCKHMWTFLTSRDIQGVELGGYEQHSLPVHTLLLSFQSKCSWNHPYSKALITTGLSKKYNVFISNLYVDKNGGIIIPSLSLREQKVKYLQIIWWIIRSLRILLWPKKTIN